MVEKTDQMSGTWWPEFFQPFRAMGERVAGFFAPSADAATTGEQYEINVELPGVAANDVDVELHDGLLTVKGEKRSQREEKGKTYFFSERSFGSFQRTFRLPADANAEGITADFKDGVLMLRVPKMGPPQEKAKKIEIRKG